MLRVTAGSCAAAALAGLVLAGCASAHNSGSAGPVPGSPVPGSAIRRLTAIVDQFVKVNGAVAPAWVSVVVTTHEKALTSATPGDTVPGNEHTIVYLVTMKGHFIANMASKPYGAKIPTGSYASIVLNAKTFQMMDFGVSPKPPPVASASFGPVTYLKT